MCVYDHSVCVALCVGGDLETGLSPFKVVLSTVYRIKKLRKGPRSKKMTAEP
jgi:hypothetical protein